MKLFDTNGRSPVELSGVTADGPAFSKKKTWQGAGSKMATIISG